MATTTNLIRTLTIRAKTEGVAQSASEMQQLAAAGEQVTKASAGQERATLSVERAYQRLQTQLDASFKAQQNMARAAQTLERAQAQGLVTSQRANDLLSMAAQQYDKTGTAISQMTQKMSENAMATDKMVRGLTAAGQAAATATRAFTDIAKGMSSVGSAALESSRATEQMTKGMSDAGRAAQPASRAFTDMVRGMSSIGRGALESSRASEQMIKGMSGLNAAAKGTGANLDQMAKRTTLARYELINLSRQFQDVVVSLASGQNPFTVFIQQGSQIADIAQTSGVGLGGMARALASMVGPLGLVAIGIGAVVAGFVLAANAWKNSAIALDNLSKVTGIAIDQLRGLEAAAAIKDISTEDFAKGMTQFAEQAELAKRGMGELNDLLRRNGETVSTDLVDNFTKVADLIARATSEQQKLQILQDAGLPKTQAWVRLMEQGGDAVKKAAEEMQGVKIDQDLIDKAREFNENWNKVWGTFKTVAFDAIGGILALLASLIDKAAVFAGVIKGIATGLANLVTTGESGVAGATFADRFDALGGGGKPLAVTIPSGGFIGPRKPVTTSADLAAMEKELSLLKQRARFLGDNASSELKLTIARKEAQIAQEKGVNLTAKEAEEYAQASLATKGHSTKLKEIKEDYSAIETAITSFGGTLINSMLDGATATEALGKALEGLGKQLINIGLQDFAKSVSKQLSDLLGQATGGLFGGLTGGIATAGIGIGISLLGKLFGKDDGGAQKQLEQAQARAAEELKKAKEAWAGMTDEVQAFNRAAAGLKLGELTGSIADLFRQAEPLIAAAARAGETAGSLDVSRTLSQGIDRLLTNFARDVERLVSEFGTKGPLAEARSEVDKLTDDFESLTDSIREFGLRTGAVGYATEKATQLIGKYIESILALIDTSEELSDIGKEIADVKAKAIVMVQALTELGVAADVAADLVQNKLIAALNRLTEDFLGQLIRDINQLAGGDWINQAEDLQRQVAQMRADAAALGIQTALIDTFFVLSAQKIIDGAELTGDAFLALVRMLDLGEAGLHQFTDAVEDATDVIVRSAEEIATAIQNNEDRLFLAIHRSDSLADQLLRFDLAAQREREAEIKAGGQALASLEAALMQERLNLINDFFEQQRAAAQQAADQAAEDARRAREQQIEEARRAAEERQRLFDEAKEFIEGQVRRIKEWIANFLAGEQSPLKPSQQLAKAQSFFASELAAAAGGSRDALSNITSAAQSLVDATRRYYGSSTTGQSIINSMISKLEGLPSQLSPEEFIVGELKPPIVAIPPAIVPPITGVITDQTTVLQFLLQQLRTAVQTGDAQATAVALLPLFETLDTTMDKALSFDEFKAGLGTSFTTGTLRGIFNELDGNGNGFLEKAELIKVATQGTKGEVTETNTLLDVVTDLLGQIKTSLLLLKSIDLHVQWCDLLQHIHTNTQSMAQWAPGSSHATGGLLIGPRHSAGGIPIAPGHWAEGGEYIMSRRAVSQVGVGTLDAMNFGHAAANDNNIFDALRGLERSIGGLERSLLRGFKALMDTQLEAAGIVARPAQEANKLARTRRGEKKKVA